MKAMIPGTLCKSIFGKNYKSMYTKIVTHKIKVKLTLKVNFTKIKT